MGVTFHPHSLHRDIPRVPSGVGQDLAVVFRFKVGQNLMIHFVGKRKFVIGELVFHGVNLRRGQVRLMIPRQSAAARPSKLEPQTVL